jgi:hypothetical protein
MSSVQTSSIAGGKESHTGVNSNPSGGVSSIGTRHSTTSNAGDGSMGTKLQPRARSSSNSSSRLLAPTASSLAKMKKIDTAPGSSSVTRTPSSTLAQATASGRTRIPSPLGHITNSPKVQLMPRRGALLSPPSSGEVPSPKKIFSKPVTVNGTSGIPVLASLRKTSGEEAREGGDKDVMMSGADTDAENHTEKNTIVRQRTFTRKPRISRSKVIAKLASQRAAGLTPSSSRLVNPPATPLSRASAAATLGTGATPKTPRGLGGKRTRSSIGARLGRTNFVGSGAMSPGAGRGDKERNILTSAKKRVRQSEYARRKSRISGFGGDE